MLFQRASSLERTCAYGQVGITVLSRQAGWEELNRTLKSLDITNSILLRTQNELIVARRQADEAQRLKEQFAANVSHEFRTPLNLILGFSKVMHLTPEVYGDMEWPSTLRRTSTTATLAAFPS